MMATGAAGRCCCPVVLRASDLNSAGQRCCPVVLPSVAVQFVVLIVINVYEHVARGLANDAGQWC